MIVERIRKLDINNRPIFTGIYGNSYAQEFFVENNLCKYNFHQELYRYLRSEGYTTLFYNAEFNFFSYEESQLETFFFKKPEDVSKQQNNNHASSHRFIAPISSPNGHNRRKGIRLSQNLGNNNQVQSHNGGDMSSSGNHDSNPQQLVSHRPNAILVKNIAGDQFFQLKRSEGVLSSFFDFVDKNPDHKVVIVFTKPSEIAFPQTEREWRTRLQTDYNHQRVSNLRHRIIVCYDVKDVMALHESFNRENGFFFDKWFSDQLFPNYNDSRQDLTKPSNALFYVGRLVGVEVANVLKRRRIMEGLENTLNPLPFEELCIQLSKRFKARLRDSDEEREIETVSDLISVPKEILEKKILDIWEKKSKVFSETALKESFSLIHGQQDNLEVVVDKVVTWVNRPDTSKRPLVLMFAGTSGTGKTYTAKCIQQSLENEGFDYLELRMNEYSSEMDSQKLLGSAPGYIGSDRESPIFEAARKNDKLVILFDEIEKAHPVIFRNLMTLMDEGYLSNGRGEKVDFRQSILIFTTNLAMNILIQQKEQMKKAKISIDSPDFQKATKSILCDNGIPPEICGRIGCLLVYNTLGLNIVARIAIEEIRKLGREYELQINNISQSILKKIVDHVTNSNEGARPVREQVSSLLEKKFQMFNMDIGSKIRSSVNLLNQAIQVDINDSEEVVLSSGVLKSTEEIISQYPKLTVVSKTLHFDDESLKKHLSKIVGQEDNVKIIAEKIGVWIRKRKKDKPLTLMLAGTSGTGKTYTSKMIQKSLSAQKYLFVRIDMNEYHSEADSWKLLGSSTGYLGSNDDPPIFSARKQSDKLVILFDEIEKAHPSLFTTIMGLMDEGMLSNGRGQKFDFKDSIIIFTTNLAMDRLRDAKVSLYESGITTVDRQFQTVMKEILHQEGLRTEICGRINWLLIYNSFNIKQTAQIALDQIREKGKDYDIRINMVSSNLLLSIANSCAGHNEGARPVRTEVENLVEPVLQAYYEDDKEVIETNQLYDLNDELQIVPSISERMVTIDEILTDVPSTDSSSQNQASHHNSPASTREITLSSTPYFSSGYNYDDYRKTMGLIILDGGKSEASGFLISADGYILTCAHCTHSEQIVFVKDDDKKEYKASVIYRNHGADIAILKIDADNMPYLQITDSMKPLKVGADIIILGYPTGTSINNNVSAFEGKVSNREDRLDYHAYQTDAIATHGSSGGAFISKLDGIVYGLLAGGYQDADINVATDIRNLLLSNDFVINYR